MPNSIVPGSPPKPTPSAGSAPSPAPVPSHMCSASRVETLRPNWDRLTSLATPLALAAGLLVPVLGEVEDVSLTGVALGLAAKSLAGAGKEFVAGLAENGSAKGLGLFAGSELLRDGMHGFPDLRALREHLLGGAAPK